MQRGPVSQPGARSRVRKVRSGSKLGVVRNICYMKYRSHHIGLNDRQTRGRCKLLMQIDLLVTNLPAIVIDMFTRQINDLRRAIEQFISQVGNRHSTTVIRTERTICVAIT